MNVATPSRKLKVTLIFPFSNQAPAGSIEGALEEFARRFPNTLKSCTVGQDGLLVAVEASSQDEAVVFNATLGDILRSHGFADAQLERSQSPKRCPRR